MKKYLYNLIDIKIIFICNFLTQRKNQLCQKPNIYIILLFVVLVEKLLDKSYDENIWNINIGKKEIPLILSIIFNLDI